MKTTHPSHPQYNTDFLAWRASLLDFCKETEFIGLKVTEVEEGEEEGFVTFTAHLVQAGKDASFTERSRFVKVGGQWSYQSGTRL